MKSMEITASGVIFDAAGRRLLPRPLDLARRLGCPAHNFDVVDHAIRNFGFVHVLPVHGALLIKLEPSVVSRFAAFAAFYEIAECAPGFLLVAYPGSHPANSDRYEIFRRPSDGLKHVEALLDARSELVARSRTRCPRSPLDRSRAKLFRLRSRPAGQAASVPGCAALAEKNREDYAKRLRRPLDAVSAKDSWLGQLLAIWFNARSGKRLPPSEALDPLQLLNIARGRAHIVDTRAADPMGYRFRLWGTVNSYGSGYANQTLGEMPTGLMRRHAIEDYWETVSTGLPNYQLIHHVENEVVYSYTRLLLPLAADGERADQLFVFINERNLPELETS